MPYIDATFMTIAIALAASAIGFWIWMLVDCVRHEPARDHGRLVWAIMIVFLKFGGAILYYFLRYRPRRVGPVSC